MSLEAQRICVESAFKSAMVANFPNVHLVFQNADVTDLAGIRATLWIIEGRSHEANIGSKVVDRHVGIVQVTISQPERTGTSQGNIIAEFIGNIFRRGSFQLNDGSLLRFRIPYATYTGSSNGYAHTIVRIPYWRDEVAR